MVVNVIELDELISDCAYALKAVDATAPQGRSKSRVYQPGVGPLTEANAIERALIHLQSVKPILYQTAAPRPYPASRQVCDIVIPEQWAIECKLIRPFGDNGVQAEHWSENVLHPYPGNTSAIGDCLKLMHSGFNERKAIIVFGFEHTPPHIDVEVAVTAFEVIARQVVGIALGPRCYALFDGLMHPHHQQGKIFGWEIL